MALSVEPLSKNKYRRTGSPTGCYFTQEGNLPESCNDENGGSKFISIQLKDQNMDVKSNTNKEIATSNI